MRSVLRDERIGVVLVACLAGWAVLSSPDAPQGVEFAGVLLVGALGTVVGHALTRWRPTAVGVVLVAGVVAAFVSGLPGSLNTEAAAAPLGYANANASLLTIATAAALLAAGQVADRSRTWWIVAAAVLSAATFGTASRAGVASCLLLLAIWPRLRTLGVGSWRWLSAGVLVVAIGVTVLVGLTTGESDQTLAAERTAPTVVGDTFSGTRAGLWADALDMVQSAPLLGYGAGSFAQRSDLAADAGTAWAHSEPLQVAAELGLVGAAISVALAAWVLLAVREVVPLIAVLLLQTTIDYVFHFPWVMLSFGLVLGAAASIGSGKPGFTPPSR